MSEFDGTFGNSADVDPVADFLAREQGQLADLDDNFEGITGGGLPAKDDFGADNFGSNDHIYGNVSSTANPDFDPFGGSAQQQGGAADYGFVSGNEADVAPLTSSDDPYSAVKSVDRQLQEPEKLRRWREEQAERLTKKDAESEKKKAEWREIARRELEDWYRHREEQLEKSKKVNRESEQAFVTERDDKKPGSEWERVCRLCDFNPKGPRTNTKDVQRMRSILLQLKQSPPTLRQ